MTVTFATCPVCGADGYIGMDGQFMHGPYFGTPNRRAG